MSEHEVTVTVHAGPDWPKVHVVDTSSAEERFRFGDDAAEIALTFAAIYCDSGTVVAIGGGDRVVIGRS